MIELKIEGKIVKVEEDCTILEAASKAGIYIPTFCHHKMLAPFGACRVCLVEVKGSPKLFTACTTPVSNGMEVIVNSDKLKKIRKLVLELLLVHHPLDCPICDKGGECTLQDLTYEFGVSKVRFDAAPKDTPADHSNPFIERDVDRCVLCGKCVRICDEVVNIQNICFINRGTDTYVGTAFDQPWHCEYCGQCMSVCPVGSLNNKIYLFKNRPWKLKDTYSICGYCSCGCTIVIDHEKDEVFRIKEDVDAGINHGFLCVKGRFGYELINSSLRKENAIIIEGERRKEVSADEAIKNAHNRLDYTVKKYGSDSIAFYISPRLTNEEAFLAQKLARECYKTENVYSSESGNFLPEATLEDVEKSDAIVVFNVDVTESNPILGYAVRRASRAGAFLSVFYPSYTALERVAKEFVIGKPDEIYEKFDKLLLSDKEDASIAKILKGAKQPILIYDPYSPYDPYYVKKLKDKFPLVKLLPAKLKNNSQGIVDMGCINGLGPAYNERKKTKDIVNALKSGEIKALIVFGENLVVNPKFTDFHNLKKTLEFMFVTDPFKSETARLADIYVPVLLYAEKEGSFTNLEGRVQSLKPAVRKDKFSDLDIIIKLFSLAGNSEIGNIKSIGEVRNIIESENILYKNINWNNNLIKYPYSIKGDFKKFDKSFKNTSNFILYPETSRLHSGTFTRWSEDLSKVYGKPILQINPEDCKKLNLNDGDIATIQKGNVSGSFKLSVNKSLTKGLLTLPSNYVETAPFFKEGPYVEVELKKVAMNTVGE
ncbi:MAG: molybdopterin-dependent oxidoreductase [Deferribacterota bacterium]|nr:molybdopterin-dependent oxidoreductase [Deferribacterota bacterium]